MSEAFASLLARRLSRRRLLGAGAMLVPAAVYAPRLLADGDAGHGPVSARAWISGSRADEVVVPGGYEARVLLRWGDPLFTGAPALDTAALAGGALMEPGAAALQERQFGYNCDAIVFVSLEPSHRRGLLCVNHEYTNAELMFPGRRAMGREGQERMAEWSRRYPGAARLELAAHGASVVEIELTTAGWRPVERSSRTRRITGNTPIEIAGPARGHPLLRTRADPTGTRVLGMLANCAGGRTPWGTFLTAEENVDDYFGGYRSYLADRKADADVVEALRRFPVLESSYHGWEHTIGRFDLGREPREVLRFGWIVEIDPRDPAAPVRKRTALGRFSHEGAGCTLARDGRGVVKMGDDDKLV